MARPFRDRSDAGRQLAALLTGYRDRADVVVLGLPRGGVPVAFEVARALGAALDVFAVRKLGVPGHEELAFGALAMGGVRVLNPIVVERAGITETQIDAVAAREAQVLEERTRAYRVDRPPPDVAGRVVIVVDDGLATGASMRAAVQALRAQHPAEVVVAVPVAAPETVLDMGLIADAVVCVLAPPGFYAVGLWYDDFSQTTDAEVRGLLGRVP